MVRRLKVDGKFGTEGFSLICVHVPIFSGVEMLSRDVVIRKVIEESKVCFYCSSGITCSNFKVVGLLRFETGVPVDSTPAHIIDQVFFLKVRNAKALRPSCS